MDVGHGAVADVDTDRGGVAVADTATGTCVMDVGRGAVADVDTCLLYTSPSPRDFCRSRMPSSA